jgi:hypothetical protein
MLLIHDQRNVESSFREKHHVSLMIYPLGAYQQGDTIRSLDDSDRRVWHLQAFVIPQTSIVEYVAIDLEPYLERKV